jgi:hypothetical protein
MTKSSGSRTRSTTTKPLPTHPSSPATAQSNQQLGANHVWALVLAGGDGTRLRSLTTRPCGTSVPKQFCSLRGGHTLLEDALKRAAGVAAAERICTIGYLQITTYAMRAF